MFMALFESKEARLARERVAVQMGRNSVKEYVNNCRSVSQRYVTMAKKALRLGQRRQAEQYVATHLQYENQANKWDSFILKIDDIVLRGTAMNAMGGLMDGISHLCKNISKGISPQNIQRTMVNLQSGMIKVDQAEQQLGNMLGGLSFNVGPNSLESSNEELPEEIKSQVGAVCDSLLDEVKVEETLAPRSNGSARPGSISHATDKETLNRINAQMDRIRKLRQNQSGS